MPAKQYKVELSTAERSYLKALSKKGEVKARTLNRAQILLLADENRPKAKMTDPHILEVLESSLSTIGRVRQRFVTEGLDAALGEKPRRGRPPKFTAEQCAKVTALACTTPQEGQAHWSLRLLAHKLVELDFVESITHTSVRNILKKTP